ncbi:MAG: hypothetical protein NZL93_07145, partial [Chthoniobacterales bacterium]|nr:hypothetical protein [Chthoniobacterales bacterium]
KEIQIYSHLSKANSQIKQFVKELGKSKLPTNWLHCLESRLNHYDPESHILTSNSRKFERITLEDFLHEKFELSKEAELLQQFTEVGLENLDLARKFLINFCNLNFKTDAVLLYQRKINSDVYELIEGGGSAAGIPRGWEKFKKEENVIFRLALRHREVLILDDLSPKRIQQHLPPILRNEFITNSMTPVSVRDELSEIGLLLLLWQKPGAASQHREKIGLLKNLLSIYTALHRGSEH